MSNLNWIVLALFLSGSETAALAAFSPAQSGKLPVQPTSTQTVNAFDPLRLLQRRPRERPGDRDGGICVVSPGLLEDENVVWSDRPLFVWKTQAEEIVMQRLTGTDQNDRILWEKPLAATAQSAVYAGQALQPGQTYTWQLEWTTVENPSRVTTPIIQTWMNDVCAEEEKA